LATTAAAATSLAIRPARAAAPKYAGFRMGMQTYTFRNFPVDQALQMIHDLDVPTVELFEAHFPSRSTPEQITAMKDRTKGLGITMLAHGVNPFTKDHEANRRWFEFAKAAGIRNLSGDPTEDSFDSLDKLVAEYDIRIAIHNHGPGARYDKVADVLNAVKGRHPNIGACADLGHYIRSAEDPVRVINLLEGRLFGIHLKDFATQTADAKGVILGQGHLDIPAVFKALKKVNFPPDACIALEYEEHPENPLEDVKACLAAAQAGAAKA
jgi:sugar phosphate isomerase/epimerase